MKFYMKLQDWLAGPFSQKMQKFMRTRICMRFSVFYDNYIYDYGWFIGKSG